MVDDRIAAAGEAGRRISVPRLLFAFLGAPTVWALHLSIVYLLDTLECITPWNGSDWAILLATAVCAAGALAAGWIAWKIRDAAREAREGEEAGGVFRFIGLIGAAGAVLFAAVILLEGTVPLFLPSCGVVQ